MIPLLLKVKGLYSYKEEQTINFEKLTASQLFGIFGSVGSGKSSILEAIMFVLYDKSDRLNKSGDNRYYNMLNLQSDELSIDFTFLTSGKGEQYRFCFSARRNGNNFEKVEVKDRSQYRLKEEKWLPVEMGDAAELLGMTYENFMQAVIIPQGKFREFIDQKPVARTQMLKELFHLQKFDLGARTASLLKKTELKIADLKARVGEVGHITEEEIQMHQQELREMETSLKQNGQLLQKLEENCQQMEALKKLFDEIEECYKQQEALHQQKSHFASKKEELNAYIKACTHFNEKLKVWSETLTDKRKKQEELKILEERMTAGEKKKLEAEKVFLEKQQLLRQKDQDKQKCDDLERIIQIRRSQADLESREKEVHSGRQLVLSIEETQQERKKKLAKQEDVITGLEKNVVNQKALQEVYFWHQNYLQLKKEMADRENAVTEQKNQLLHVQERKNEILGKLEWVPAQIDFTSFYSLLVERQQKVRQRQEQYRDQLRDLQVKEKLSIFAQSLKTGDACPLCGSTQHPAISHTDSVDQELKQLKEKLERSGSYEQELLSLEREVRSLEAGYQSAEQGLKDKTSQFQQAKEKNDSHRKAFMWDDYRHKTYDDVVTAVKEYEQVQQQAISQKQEMKQLRLQYEAQEEKLKAAQDKLQHYKEEHTKLLSSCEHLSASLKILKYERLREHPLSTLETNLTKGRKRLLEIENEYEEAQKIYADIDKGLSMLEGKKETVQTSLQELSVKAENLDQEIQTLCVEKNFDNVDQVSRLLALELNTDAVQQEITSYENQVHNTEVTLHKLKADAQGKEYDLAAHHKAVDACQHLKIEVQKLQESCALSRKHIFDMIDKRKKGQELMALLNTEEERESNLKELAGLFRGSGFVNYASTVLLENLCRAANHRFMKLTRNNLSLELNENNDFVVRDFLNNGRTRLLKTLSGGQTFQAALCLALSLAENVKSLNQSDQSFFFLDEGFGALDKESLRVVFDTLKSLRQEKRIVGIISHVEELQQEIDVYLTVKNDKEKGSIIQNSWE